MTSNEQFDQRLEQYAKATASGPSIVDDVMSKIETESIELESAVRNWRYRIKRSGRLKRFLAVAAVLAIVFTGLTTWFVPGTSRAGIVFGDVIERFIAIQTARFTLRVETEDQPPQTIQFLMMGTSTRQEHENGTVSITDHASGEVLTLLPSQRMASILPMHLAVKSSPQANVATRFVENLKALQDKAEVRLGEREIEGRTATGFQLDMSGTEWTIWADVETGLPAEIKLIVPLFNITAVATGFTYGIEMNPSLFSMEPPDDYTLHKPITKKGPGVVPCPTPIDLSEPTEQDLIDYLRIAAEANEGVFPDQTKALADPITRARQEAQESNRDVAQVMKEALPDIIKRRRMLGFLKSQQAVQPMYVGSGVKLGDATQAVFCWGLPGGEEVRVIYGNFIARNIPVKSEEFKDILIQAQKSQRRESK